VRWRWTARSIGVAIQVLGATAAAAPPADPVEPLQMLGVSAQPGELRRLTWMASESFTGASLPVPVFVAHGVRPGPTLCLTGGVHGDELNGIEVVRRVIEETDPSSLRGTLIGVPIVNLHGFRQSSRYLPDRRDLNRYFPGRARGSTASRIAHSFFERVVRHCGALVDLHTGSFHRTNIPQVRGDLALPEVVDLARGFGTAVVVHNAGLPGTLRRAATDAGIAAITYEAGEPMRFQQEEVERGVRGVRHLLAWRGMVDGARAPRLSQEVYHRSRWVRVDDGGILLAQVALGDEVEEGQPLATVTDPISNERSSVLSPQRGRIIGMAVNQVVIPGFAAFHVGVPIDERRRGFESLDALEPRDLLFDAGEAPDASDHVDLDERPE
jgi:predicted deacylase